MFPNLGAWVSEISVTGSLLHWGSHEWIPTVGYMGSVLAQEDISRFLMERYNWR